MAVWEYKVVSSGKGGFATPALMETFLNQLGKEEWEIISFHTPPDNPLAFQGLARRTTQRDWTLEDAAAAAARAEADKLRAEFEAKFKGSGAGGGAGAGSDGEERAETVAEQKANSDDGLRKLRDTEHDLDSDAEERDEEERGTAAAAGGEADDWDKLAKEEELPTFFEAIQPLMRRNQRGAGMSVGVDHLAKKWGLSEDDIMGALKECGFSIPDDEDDKPEYVEYDGDLFWVNVNRRGEIWVNTKEKPRPVFKPVKAQRFAPEPAPGSSGGTAGGAEGGSAEGTASGAGVSGAEGGGESERGHSGTGEEAESGGSGSRRGREGRSGDRRSREGGSGEHRDYQGGSSEHRAEGAPAGEGGEHSESQSSSEAAEGGSGDDQGDSPQRHGDEQQRKSRDDRGGNGGRGRDDRRRGLPEGAALLERIRPLMRRDRGGQGASGSVGFLSRALKCRENELVQAFAAMGLTLPGSAGEPAGEFSSGDHVWGVHKDQRGGIWITDRRQRGHRGGEPGGQGGHGAPEGHGDSSESAVPVPSGEESSGPSGPAATDDLTGHGSPISASAAAATGDPALSSEAPAMPAGGQSEASDDNEESDEDDRGENSGESARPRRAHVSPTDHAPGTEDSHRQSAASGSESGAGGEGGGGGFGAELLASLRPLLKETRTGALAGDVAALAERVGRTAAHLLSELVDIGLKVPEKVREKAVTVEVDGAAVSLTRNAKDEIWVNVKTPGANKPKRMRRGPVEDAGEPESPEPSEG